MRINTSLFQTPAFPWERRPRDEVGVLPIMACLYGEAPPEKGKGFYSLEYMTGYGILSFGSVKGPKGLADEFYGFIKSGKLFCDCFLFN